MIIIMCRQTHTSGATYVLQQICVRVKDRLPVSMEPLALTTDREGTHVIARLAMRGPIVALMLMTACQTHAKTEAHAPYVAKLLLPCECV